MKKKTSLLLLSSLLLMSIGSSLSACQFPHGEKNHKWEVQEVVQEPTCTEDGIVSYSCQCGETKTERLEAEGHLYGKAKVISEATCKSEGITEKSCKVCEYTKTEKTDPINHSYVNGVCKWCKSKESNANGSQNITENASSGLTFTSSGNGTYYLSGMGSCKDTALVVPSTHSGKAVTGIVAGAFPLSNNIVSIEIPSSVTTIDEIVFDSCEKLKEIKVDAANQKYSSQNGVLYNKAMTTLICYPQGKTGASFEIPTSVTKIELGAFFENASLSSVSIPAKVSAIGELAFFSCSNLKTITVNSANSNFCSVNGVLYNKAKTSLLCYPAAITASTFKIPNTVKTIASGAFEGNYNLSVLYLGTNVTTIGDYAFENCFRLIQVCYSGSASDWSRVSVGKDNTPLNYAEFFYNYSF